MIKVIKDGQNKFKQTCSVCGCEISFEIEDLNQVIYCPTCGRILYDPNSLSSNPNSIKQLYVSEKDIDNPCKNCSYFYEKLNDRNNYVGDTPCTFCPNSPFRVTC